MKKKMIMTAFVIPSFVPATPFHSRSNLTTFNQSVTLLSKKPSSSRLPFPSSSPSIKQTISMSASPIINVGDVPSRLGTLISEQSKAAISEKGTFTVAISGGSLPKLLSQGMSQLTDVNLSKWTVFLADERIVPLDHADSNYREIISRLPNVNIIPIDPSLPPAQCAQQYQHLLIEKLGSKPVFDSVLLGLGPDGHTCSLFPQHPLLQVDDRLIAHIEDSPKPPPQRVTLTVPVLNAASSVVFVCTGAGKAPVVKDILENSESTLPGALVRPTSGSCHWFLDEAAASELATAKL